jgi:hypothetical protein
LSNCDLSIGVIPITSLSKLLVGVKPGDEFSSIGLIGVIPIPPLTQFCCSKIFSVTKLTDAIIRAAIESFINPKDYPDDDELRWLKLYHVIPKLTTEEIDEILNRKKKEEIQLDAEIDAEFEDE